MTSFKGLPDSLAHIDPADQTMKNPHTDSESDTDTDTESDFDIVIPDDIIKSFADDDDDSGSGIEAFKFQLQYMNPKTPEPLTGQAKYDFIFDIMRTCIKIGNVDEELTIQERTDIFESALSKFKLDDTTLKIATDMIDDCRKYPCTEVYQYDFEHNGFKCYVKRYAFQEYWVGRVTYSIGDDNIWGSFMTNPQLQVHKGLDSAGPTELGFSCNQEPKMSCKMIDGFPCTVVDTENVDISCFSVFLYEFLSGGSNVPCGPGACATVKTYKNFDYVVAETKKLADKLKCLPVFSN